MEVWNLQKDLEGHKQRAATLSWKEHKKGFGDQMKKEKTWHLHGRAEKGGRLAIHRPEGWRGAGGFWHSDLLRKVTGTLPGRLCVISNRHPGETAPSQPVFLTSNKKPLHIKVQFSFPPSRFIFPSYVKCHGNCSPGNNSPGRNRQVLPVFGPVGFCSKTCSLKTGESDRE